MMRLILAIFMSLLFFTVTAKAENSYTEDKTHITVTADHPEFTIQLKSNPTTGYSWYLRGYRSSVIQPIKHHFIPAADKKLIGAGGYEVWTFKVKKAGFTVPQQMKLRFVYARPWEKEAKPKKIIFYVTTAGAL